MGTKNLVFFSWMPRPVRVIIAQLLHLLASMNRQGVPMSVRNKLSKFQRLTAMLKAEDRQYFYRVLLSAEVYPQRFVLETENRSRLRVESICLVR